MASPCHKTILPVPCLWARLFPSVTRVTWQKIADLYPSYRFESSSRNFPYKTRWNYLFDALRPQPLLVKQSQGMVYMATFRKWFPESPHEKGTAGCSKGIRLFRVPMVHTSELSWIGIPPQEKWIGAWGLGWHIVAQFLLRPSNLSLNNVILYKNLV